MTELEQLRALESGGEAAAAALVAGLASRADNARKLTFRLYTVAERRTHAAEALSYDGLVQCRAEIMRLAPVAAVPTEPAQAALS